MPAQLQEGRSPGRYPPWTDLCITTRFPGPEEKKRVVPLAQVVQSRTFKSRYMTGRMTEITSRAAVDEWIED